MDLNIENYSYNDILTVLSLQDLNLQSNGSIDINILHKTITTKINEIIRINERDLPEPKQTLIGFFMDCYFKVFETITAKTNQDTLEHLNKYNRLLSQHKNDVIKRDSNFIINNTQPDNNIDTFNVPFKKGIINPLTIKTLKQVVNINSRFRENYNTTQSANYSITLPETLKKVISMKLLNYCLPYNVYSVSDKLGSNTFVINDTEIRLDNGSYNDPRVMVDVINKRLDEANINVELCYNSTNGTMTFSSTDDEYFSIDFNTNNNTILPNNINRDHITLGWMLGFRGDYLSKIPSMNSGKFFKNKSECYNLLTKDVSLLDNYYYGKTSYQGESIFDNYGNKYFMLSVNDYQNNHNNIFVSPFKFQSMNDNNIIAKINLENRQIEYPSRIYFGPTDLTKLTISIYDEFGRIIDNNNADYSIELLCESIYDN